MITWNTLPESYQQKVYEPTLAPVKSQIQQAENPTPAMVVTVEAAGVDNGILLDYFTAKVALEDSEIGSIDPHILMVNNCMYDELHFGIPDDSRDF